MRVFGIVSFSQVRIDYSKQTVCAYIRLCYKDCMLNIQYLWQEGA